jgi:PAS domain S-box-containing protein
MPKDTRRLFIVFLTMAMVLLFSGAVVYVIGARVLRAHEIIRASDAAIAALDRVLQTCTDGETGQRGYLLVGDEGYLKPYADAVSRVEGDLAVLATQRQIPAESVEKIRKLVHTRFSELQANIELRRSGNIEAVRSRIGNDGGKQVMDALRQEIGAQVTLQQQQIAWEHALADRGTFVRTMIFIGCAAVNLAFILWAFRRVMWEIDRRDLATQDARQQRETYATTLSSIGDAVITTDSKGRITFINQVAQDLTGWAGHSAMGQPIDEVFPIINETTRLPVESPVEKVLRLGTVVGLANHTLLIRKDGSELPIDDSGAPIRNADGRIRGVVLVFRDFSEYKKSQAAINQSEQRLRLAVEGAELGTFYGTLPLDKLNWNDKCKEHFWLPSDAQVDINLFYSRLHPDDRESARLAMERAQLEQAPYDVEFRTVSPAGHLRWVRAMGRFFYNDKNEPTRFDGITIDVTDRKLVEQRLREAHERAESANKAKDQFLATLSHELRTPLTPVLATLGMWDRNDADLPAHVRAEVAMMRRNIELEARLIDDLLDLTRVVRGKMVLSPQPVDVHEILQEVVNTCHEDTRTKNIDVALELGATAPTVKADPARLQQVFWNILRNAIKFSPRNSHVQVATGNVDGQLSVTISDSGIGMTPEQLERLFRPFEQGSEDITRRFGGLGLGLAISKALVDAHGGKLQAHSEGEGCGARFTVTLPSVAENPAKPASQPAPEPKLVRPRRRVLIVEDHADTARILEMVIRNWGHEVTIADSVATAIAAARDGDFDLILSDIGLPDGTGLDLIRQVRAFSPVPAIALTGFGMDDDVARTRAAGFNAHLTKPTNLHELEVLLNQLTAAKA